ncbi:MAG: hypothetical protein NTV32_10695, partial [Gammaproteobacteria bacterium]|nr:hypothetical protein [Gammaproteobacteria bacterium]
MEPKTVRLHGEANTTTPASVLSFTCQDFPKIALARRGAEDSASARRGEHNNASVCFGEVLTLCWEIFNKHVQALRLHEQNFADLQI